jgi:hypothetical protein
MSLYNWQNIFKSKSDKELVEIFKGNSNLDFEAEIYAGIELKNRNFDFSLIQEVYNQKVIAFKRDLIESQNLEFRNSEYFRNQIFYLIGILLIFSIFVLKGFKFDQQIKSYKALIYLGFLIFSLFTAKWNFNRFKAKKEKTLKQKEELLKLLESGSTHTTSDK